MRILKASIYKALVGSLVEKNALEMQTSLCSKELFQLNIEQW